MRPTIGHKGATFSPCRTWRYRLWRHFAYPPQGKILAVIGLNPSTADEEKDDPTIRRVIGYAQAWGFGGIVMLNLFALRSTDPRVLRSAPDPIGPDNNRHLIDETAGRRVLCAWGSHGTFRGRGRTIMELLWHADLVCLGLTAEGQPKHPLYLKADMQPIPLVAELQGRRPNG